MVLELARPADWQVLSTVWRGVQADFEWPAPAIAVNGVDGYQLWFSVAEPIPVEQAAALLESLCARYLSAVAPERIVKRPSRDETFSDRFDPSGLVPVERTGTGLWSAFVAPDLAAIFSNEPWLDVSPSAEAQAKILMQLECTPTAKLHVFLASINPGTEAESAPRSSILFESHHQPPEPAANLTPRQFLLDIMNDTTVELSLRIDAAKALLPYS